MSDPQGIVIEKLITEWRADYSKLKDDMAKVKEQLNQGHQEAKKLSESFKAGTTAAHQFGNGLSGVITKAGALAASLFSLNKVVNFVGSSIKLAMDVVEDEQLYEESLGRMSAATRDWSEDMQRALGVNAFEVRKNVGLWYEMTKSMGLAENTALGMSKNLIQLKYDLASFYNLSEDRVDTIIEGMIAGMSAPAKAIGVILTDEMAKRALVTEGIIQEGQAVDSTTMMYGRYLALMNQTSTAHGDMARTIDSPANQLRVMQAELRRASLELGQSFIPVLQAVIPWLSYVASFIRLVASALASLFGARKTTGVAAAAQSTTESIQGVSTGVQAGAQDWENYGKSAAAGAGKAKQAAKDLQTSILGFDALNKLTDPTSASGGGSGGGGLSPGGGGFELGDLNADFEAIGDELSRWRDKAQEIDDKVREFIKALVDSPIGVFGQTILEVFGGIYNDMLLPLGAWLLENTEFTIGALEGILVGVLSFRAAGLIFGPGSPIAIGIGIIGGLAGAIDGFLRESERKRLLEDMAGRWGDIALNAEQVNAIVGMIFSNINGQQSHDALEKIRTLERRTQDWKRSLDGIMAQTYVYSLGVKMSDSDLEKLQSGIDAVIEEGQQIFSEAKFNLPLTFGVIDLPEESMQALVQGYDLLELDFIEQGKKLRSAFDNAIADGVIDAAEFQMIQNLQQEIQETLSRVADVKNSLVWKELWKLDPGMEMDEDSWRRLSQASDEYRQELTDENKKLKINALMAVEIIPNLTDEERQAMIDDVERQFNERAVTITLTHVKAQLEGLGLAFKDVDFSNVFSMFDEIDLQLRGYLGESNTRQIFDTGYIFTATREAIESNFMYLGDLYNQFSNDFARSLGVSYKTRKNLASVYEDLIPSAEQLTRIYNEAVKAGEQPPKGVAEGLLSIHAVGAVANNMDSLMFMMGHKMSKDPAMLQLYQDMIASGEKIDANLAAGIELGLTYPEGATLDMIDTVMQALANGDYKTAAEALGRSIPKTFSDGVFKGKTLATSAMQSLASAVSASATSHFRGDKTALFALADWMSSNEEAILGEISAYQEAGMSLVDAMIEAYSKSAEADKEGGRALLAWMRENKSVLETNMKLLTMPSSNLAKALQNAFASGLIPDPPAELLSWLAANENTLMSKIEPYLLQGHSLGDAIVTAFANEMGEEKASKPAILAWANALSAYVANNGATFTAIGTNAGSRVRIAVQNELNRTAITFTARGNVQLKTPAGNLLSYATAYATGGFPDVGEFFMARENGPELVGRMGSKTAVANNDQIVSGISAGVYEAVKAAMGGSQQDGGGTVIVPVYIGPEKIYEAVVAAGDRRSLRAGRRL